MIFFLSPLSSLSKEREEHVTWHNRQTFRRPTNMHPTYQQDTETVNRTVLSSCRRLSRFLPQNGVGARARPSAAFADTACCSTTASELLPSATRVSQSTCLDDATHGAIPKWRPASKAPCTTPQETTARKHATRSRCWHCALSSARPCPVSPALSLHPHCTRPSRVSRGASLTNHPLCPVSPQGTAADG